jgi:hypothetical protein
MTPRGFEEEEGMAFTAKAKVSITPPNLQTSTFRIIGTAPLVQNKFSARVLEGLARDQAEGPSAKKAKKREPKDFDRCVLEATHIAEDGWAGIPASAFRCGLISTCRLLGFPMTLAKLSVFVLADGYERDKFGVQPLVKITKGEPERTDFAVRNATGVADIRPRPMWREGWEAVVSIQYDADQFTLEDVTNLLARMGAQVGIGAGRHDSKDSTGMGWGTFRLEAAAPPKKGRG